MTILHIGFRKCASTAIQRRLLDTAEKLEARHGLAYLPFEKRAGRIQFQDDLAAQQLSASSLRFVGRVDEALARGLTPIVSNEMFEGLTPPSIARLKAILPSVSRVVAVIRDPRELIPSIYGFRTQRGANVRDFDQFYAQLQRRDPMRGRFLDVLEPWAEAFGWDAVSVHFMGAGSSDVVRDVMADMIATPGADLALRPHARVRANLTLGWRGIEVLRDAFAILGAARDEDAGQFIDLRGRQIEPLLAQRGDLVRRQPNDPF
ncbi:MAG: hypothetical protein EON87_18955, partial [Brevundimonas sp.]